MWATRLASFTLSQLRRNRRRGYEATDDSSNLPIQATGGTQRATNEDEFDSDKCHSLPLLFNLCRRWAWPAIAFRCQTHPHEAAAQDENGDTALHWAVFGNPPLVAVEALLKACPDLAGKANKDGRVPLHGT